VGRSLVTRSTRTVGIVVTDMTSIFYPYVVAPLHDEVALHGYQMVVFTEGVESGEPPSEAAVERLLDRSIDGAVLTTSRLDGAVPRQLWQRGLPFVFLTRVVEGSPRTAQRSTTRSEPPWPPPRWCGWATAVSPPSSDPATPAQAAIASAERAQPSVPASRCSQSWCAADRFYSRPDTGRWRS
jgi:hypothetical protein